VRASYPKVACIGMICVDIYGVFPTAFRDPSGIEEMDTYTFDLGTTPLGLDWISLDILFFSLIKIFNFFVNFLEDVFNTFLKN
jgi:hypothetical protein